MPLIEVHPLTAARIAELVPFLNERSRSIHQDADWTPADVIAVCVHLWVEKVPQERLEQVKQSKRKE